MRSKERPPLIKINDQQLTPNKLPMIKNNSNRNLNLTIKVPNFKTLLDPLPSVEKRLLDTYELKMKYHLSSLTSNPLSKTSGHFANEVTKNNSMSRLDTSMRDSTEKLLKTGPQPPSPTQKAESFLIKTAFKKSEWVSRVPLSQTND